MTTIPMQPTGMMQPPGMGPQRGPMRPEYRGPLMTALGKEWAPRRRAAERFYEINASDFEELRNLYVNASEMREGWRSNVAMAWSVMQALIADSFFKNPEPVILPLTPARDEQAQLLTDLGRTWHEIAGTEGNVRDARALCGIHGGAIIWVEEEAEYQDARAYDDETGEPMYQRDEETGDIVLDEETGEPIDLYELDGQTGEPLKEAVRQSCTQTLIDLHGWRVDPDCRRWDHKDAKWIERRYERSLQSFLDDSAFSETAKGMLTAWAKSRRRQRGEWDRGRNDVDEKDPRMRMIQCGEIWSMAHGKIIHMPVDAEFHLEGATPDTKDGFPIPSFWLENKMYPGVLFAYNKEPEDRHGTKGGYYPIPDLRLVKSRLHNLNRLEGLILNLCTQQTTKYVTQEGLFDNAAQRRLESDVPREIIPVDVVGALKRLVQAGVALPSSLESLILPLNVEQNAALVKHFEAFAHETNLIRETLAMGPASRGGIPDANTATGQIQVGEAIAKRNEIDSERTSAYIDGLTERYFLLLQNRQTLPVYYRDTSVHGESFRQFVVDQGFRSLRMSFSHRTGTARGVDREVQRAQIRESLAIVLPLVEDPVQKKVLVKKYLETFDDKTLSQVVDNDLSQLAEQAAVVQQQIMTGEIPLESAGIVLMEILSKFISAHLTQAGVDRAVQQAAGAPPPLPSGEPTASPAKAKSAGKLAFDKASGLAAAGAVGGRG